MTSDDGAVVEKADITTNPPHCLESVCFISRRLRNLLTRPKKRLEDVAAPPQCETKRFTAHHFGCSTAGPASLK